MWSTPEHPSFPDGSLPLPAEAHDLRRLLPSLGTAPAVQFRTLNGFQFHAVALPWGAEETPARRIRRLFQIQPPAGEPYYCAVDVTGAVRRVVAEAAGRNFAPDDPVWDLVCRTSLCARLGDETKLPPDYLPVYQISGELREAVLAMVR